MTEAERLRRLEEALVHLVDSLHDDVGDFASTRRRNVQGARRTDAAMQAGDRLAAIVAALRAEPS